MYTAIFCVLCLILNFQKGFWGIRNHCLPLPKVPTAFYSNVFNVFSRFKIQKTLLIPKGNCLCLVTGAPNYQRYINLNKPFQKHITQIINT
ncbi:hypothetical protein XENTR_v10003925 [Xenopus tropicalis]|nr:hypothetical protein XENTR_v10003925 [Xenopus tropicalis]